MKSISFKEHPQEIELSRVGADDNEDEQIDEHLRWCARCRSVVIDYRWLQGEVTSALRTEAEAVVVPGPKWWEVQRRLLADQRRRAVSRLVSASAGAALTVASMLAFSFGGVGAGAMAQTLPPEPVVAPAPATVPMRVVTSPKFTPTAPCTEAGPSPTPAFVLPPTPPPEL